MATEKRAEEMKKEEIQKELPDGLLLGNELPDVLPVGRWFSTKDSRLNVPVDRTICFLEIQMTEGWENGWKEQLLASTDKLSSTPLKFVAPPLEINFNNEGNSLYIVTNSQNSILSDQIRKEKWHSGDVSFLIELFEQIVEGVHELHQLKLPYGILLPQNISFKETKTGSLDYCQLRNAEWGPLYQWAKGHVRENGVKEYFPPEWDGHPQAPSLEADLYALGLLGCKLFLGNSDYSSPSNENKMQELKNDLKAKNVPSYLRDLLCSLVHPEAKKRPHNISEVRTVVKQGSWMNVGNNVWQKFNQNLKQSSLISGLIVLLFFIFCFWLGNRQSGEVIALTTKITELNKEVIVLKSDKQRLRKSETIINQKNDSLEKENEYLRGQLPDDSPIKQAEKLADYIWNRLSDKQKEETNGKFYQLVKGELGKSEKSKEVKKLADETLVKKYKAQIKALEKAVNIWKTFAEQDISWTAFEARTEADVKAIKDQSSAKLVGEYLIDWKSRINKRNGKSWAVSLLRGRVKGEQKNDFGKGRLVTMYVRNKEVTSDSVEWNNTDNHTYKEKTGYLEFNWKLGEPVGILMESNNDWSKDFNMISDNKGTFTDDPITFKGPIAIWHMNMEEWIEDSDTGAGLKLHVIDCPGPTFKQYSRFTVLKKAAKRLLPQ